MQEVADHWDRRHEGGKPVVVRTSAAEDADDADDGEADAATAARAAWKAASGASGATALSDAQRVVLLEAALAEARKPRPMTLRGELDHVLHAAGASFGWGVVYFSLWPAWWGGQTLGKKLFGLRVLELTGKPMTVMRCLKRYGGYAAGMATGGLGFAQVLWDPNRQGLHDKAAHTAVLDLRAAAAAARPEPGPETG